VVLAARRADGLEATAHACRQAGTNALVVPTDVTGEADVVHLTQAASRVEGRIDVWVNNAGVTCFGSLDSTPFEPHQRVLETNVHGAMFGPREVVPIFKRQGHGVLINVGSVLSKVGQPYVPSYVISKFALRGLSEALRTELANYPQIHVCTLMPYAVDTPHSTPAPHIFLFRRRRGRRARNVRLLGRYQRAETPLWTRAIRGALGPVWSLEVLRR
jgi:NAD(P)-dependent dehydrogenase (short-subunit alcohol dehydrogenase family)